MATESLNELSIVDVPDLSACRRKSINFACYIEGETSTWMMDSGFTQHVTPFKIDFKELIAQGKGRFAMVSNMELEW